MISVAVLGKGKLATHIAQSIHSSSEYELACVVPSIPHSPWFESLETAAQQLQVPLAESGLADEVEHHVDLLICSSYNRILSKTEINKRGRALNFHFSPLPAFRGVRPINWALELRKKFHGVSLHEIDEGIDTGGILDQIVFPINPEIDEVLDVYKRCVSAGVKLFDRNLPNLMNGPANLENRFTPSYFSSADDASLIRFRELTRFPTRLGKDLPL